MPFLAGLILQTLNYAICIQISIMFVPPIHFGLAPPLRGLQMQINENNETVFETRTN